MLHLGCLGSIWERWGFRGRRTHTKPHTVRKYYQIRGSAPLDPHATISSATAAHDGPEVPTQLPHFQDFTNPFSEKIGPSHNKSSFASRQKMDSERAQLFFTLLPKLPLILRVVILHVLRRSEPAKYLDLRSALTVSLLRSFLAPDRPLSISETQKLTSKDPGIKGRIWVSKYATPVPQETGVRDALLSAIENLRDAASIPAPARNPDILPVEAEWTGYRANAKPDSTLPEITEKEKYDELMKECSNPTTILYFHGGAYYLLDPSSHRPTTKKLAKLTGGRCYSIRYRLAPQNPFPAALLDGLISYLALLYPPPESFHEPVSPSHIVFAGDSAGGNLALALLQTVLEIRRQNIKVAWFGEEREVPLPAGVALNSPWVDLTLSSLSWEKNKEFDYLPSLTAKGPDNHPPCEVWPADPPRASLYADDAFLDHPLVTLVLAKDWSGAPPVFMCTGWELLADEDKFLALRLRQDGVRVVFEEYEAMPHCFAMILTNLPAAKRCFQGWSGFIKNVVKDPANIAPSAITVKAKTLQEVDLDLTEEDLTEEVVHERVRAQIKARISPNTSKL
ncbi:hypothetical protein jhhlp_000204 [Lomentospora prolificans]|uniref:Alpha/beta hydrolase fold-3 domain-containing protein n=1 Tax=Lomentospora prolificans TaxID=41688 RepID=A0A2N3NKB0_9PEZI|nr:hypothetical protein jhhlp_000204 [Lomentospora prolificans]